MIHPGCMGYWCVGNNISSSTDQILINLVSVYRVNIILIDYFKKILNSALFDGFSLLKFPGSHPGCKG